jgi:hypothetical protein
MTNTHSDILDFLPELLDACQVAQSTATTLQAAWGYLSCDNLQGFQPETEVLALISDQTLNLKECLAAMEVLLLDCLTRGR